MSSSEEEDERLKEAIAPNFYIGSDLQAELLYICSLENTYQLQLQN